VKILKIVPGLPTPFDPNRMTWLEDYMVSLSRFHSIRAVILESRVHYLKPMYLRTWLRLRRFPEFRSSADNLEYLPLPYWAMPGYLLYRQVTFPVMRRALETLVRQKELGDIDLIHAQFCSPAGTLAMHLSKMLKKPYVVSVLESNFDYILDRGVAVSDVLENADHVITITEYLENWVLKRCRIPAHKRSIIPMGTDFSRFRPASRPNPVDGDPRLLFVAGLVPHKGCDLLVRAMKLLADRGLRCSLDVIGVGPEYPKLVHLARESGIEDRIRFHGRLARHADLERYYRECDVFVLPSYTEGQGVVIVEAMACGKPVVSTRSGGAETIMHGRRELGELVPTGNAEALAEGIERVVERLSDFEPAAIRAFAEKHYSVESVAARTAGVYERLLHE
jgi:glycosyltransferase involved in cell wall biosynthesis